MITKEQNERLTQTGPETPGGQMLRMYWHAIGTMEDLQKDPVRPVRLLSEDLHVLYHKFRNISAHPGRPRQRPPDHARLRSVFSLRRR